MKQTLLQEKYPVYTLEVPKAECRSCVDEHEIARMIGVFDHLEHTNALPQGEVAEDIQAAKHVVFCFGTHLPNPHVMAVRPRSIGVADMGDRFVVSFLEAPMPQRRSPP